MEVVVLMLMVGVVAFKAGEKYGKIEARADILDKIDILQEKMQEMEKKEFIQQNDTEDKYKNTTTGFYTSKKIKEEEE